MSNRRGFVLVRQFFKSSKADIGVVGELCQHDACAAHALDIFAERAQIHVRAVFHL